MNAAEKLSELEITFDGKQRQAIEMCCAEDRIVAVTGSAGTGKTTIIQRVANQMVEEGWKVICCAPTGKAARRVKEATGIEAVTIHRLLEFPKPNEIDEKTGKPLDVTIPRRDKDNRIQYDFVICDEYAMVPHELNRQLIDALPNGGLLRCFGDIHQLSPIEKSKIKVEGFELSPFQQHLKRFPSVTLDRVYRQSEGSGIFANGARIVNGMAPASTDDFVINFTDRPVLAVEELLYKEPAKWGSIQNQIIVTGHKTWVGTYELNMRAQMIINPEPEFAFDPIRHKWMESAKITIGIGDKVVCTENCYDLRDLFERWEGEPYGKESFQIPTPDNAMMLNGEIGKVVEIQRHGKDVEAVLVDFGDRVVSVPFEIHEYSPKSGSIFKTQPIKALDLGYVLTTHKCQGSEFQEICYVLNKSSKFTQNRRNLYTAVTRARKQVTVITDRASLSYSLWNQK